MSADDVAGLSLHMLDLYAEELAELFKQEAPKGSLEGRAEQDFK